MHSFMRFFKLKVFAIHSNCLLSGDLASDFPLVFRSALKSPMIKIFALLN